MHTHARDSVLCVINPTGIFGPTLSRNLSASVDLAARLLGLKDRSAARRRHRGGLAPRQARRVADYVEANLAEDQTLAELATLAGLSPNHFCTAFGESFGQSPAACLQARRIARAQAMMLDQPDLGLSPIAQAVGYASQSAFRKLVGTRPGRWRQVMRA
jgi:AraC family transcriptional regulator